MTFPQVAAVNDGHDTSDTTSHIVNLPSGIQADDLLLVFFVVDTDPVITFPGGWTEVFKESKGTSITAGLWYRIADGGEGATIIVSTNIPQMAVHTSYRITGYSGTPEAGTATDGYGSTLDPPNLTPSWGAKDTLWFAAEGNDDGREDVTAWPTNYTNPRHERFGVAQSCGVGTARRELNATSENPSAFTLSASEEWVANTVAIQPAAFSGIENKSASMAAKMIAGKLI